MTRWRPDGHGAFVCRGLAPPPGVSTLLWIQGRSGFAGMDTRKWGAYHELAGWQALQDWGIWAAKAVRTQGATGGQGQGYHSTDISVFYKQYDCALLLSSVQFISVTQLCPTLCDPMNCSLAPSVCQLRGHVWPFATSWTVARQAPLSMEFSRQKYWSGLPFPSPGDFPDPGIEPGSPALQADSLPSEPVGKPLLLEQQCIVEIQWDTHM